VDAAQDPRGGGRTGVAGAEYGQLQPVPGRAEQPDEVHCGHFVRAAVGLLQDQRAVGTVGGHVQHVPARVLLDGLGEAFAGHAVLHHA
jgi:hypothetical protein